MILPRSVASSMKLDVMRQMRMMVSPEGNWSSICRGLLTVRGLGEAQFFSRKAAWRAYCLSCSALSSVGSWKPWRGRGRDRQRRS